MKQVMKSNLLHSELSYSIIGAAMDTHNQLGPGWDEEAYHVALLYALREKGLHVHSKLRGTLKHAGRVADLFELDILVEDKVILELKHILGNFDPAHYVQLINYLKFWNKDLGILINFGLDRLQSERIPFTPKKGDVKCIGVCQKQTDSQNDSSRTVEKILMTIFDQHGLGYGRNVYKKLFRLECSFQKVRCEQPCINLSYHSVELGSHQMDAFSVNADVLVAITAMTESTSAVQLARMLSYLRKTKKNSEYLPILEKQGWS